MRLRSLGRPLIAAMGLMLSWICVPVALAYDTELQVLAEKLVAQMEAAGQKSGTVIDFKDLQNVPNELGRFLAQELSNRLVMTSKKMSFVDRESLQTLLRERKMTVDGLLDPTTTKQLGNMIGVDTVILGTTTVLGDTIRLLVRAVAVESAKIIVIQAATLPTAGGLAGLYTRGVGTGSSSESNTLAPSPDARSRLRGDSIKFTGKDVHVVPVQSNMPHVLKMKATLTLENLSGMGFDAGIVSESISVGSCILGRHDERVSVLSVIKASQSNWRYIPVGGKMNFTISGLCRNTPLSTMKTTDVSASLMVKMGDQEFSLPITAASVPVRADKPRQ